MARPGSPTGGAGRRARRVAGQRRMAGGPPTSYLPPVPEQAPARPTAPPPSPGERPQPSASGPGWPARAWSTLRSVPARLRLADRARGLPAADRWPAIVALVAITAIVACGTLTGLYLQGYLHARAVAHARADAAQAAAVGLPRFASYSYQHFDADVAAAEKYMTPAYRKVYADFQAKAVRAAALRYHATVTADLAPDGAGIGVLSGGTSHVQLLVFLNQTQTNTKIPAPRLSPTRLRVDMRKVGGHWLIDHVIEF